MPINVFGILGGLPWTGNNKEQLSYPLFQSAVIDGDCPGG